MRLLNKQAVLAILNSRTEVTTQNVGGKSVLFKLQGDGNIIDIFNKAGEPVMSVVEPGTQMQSYIYNVKCNSKIALANPRNKELSASALAAEKAGKFEEAHELWQKWLSAVQVSFNVPSTDKINAKLSDRCEFSAKVVMITTDNGSLLTIDPKTIVVAEPETLSKTAFSFDEDEIVVPVTPSELEALKA